MVRRIDELSCGVSKLTLMNQESFKKGNFYFLIWIVWVVDEASLNPSQYCEFFAMKWKCLCFEIQFWKESGIFISYCSKPYPMISILL